MIRANWNARRRRQVGSSPETTRLRRMHRRPLYTPFRNSPFEPSGWSPNPEIRYAKSVMDYIFRWLAIKFLPRDAQPREDASIQSLNGKEAEKATELASQFTRATTEAPPQGGYNTSMTQGGLAGVNQSDDAPSCADCGAIMVRNGACYKCLNCGSTSGCS